MAGAKSQIKATKVTETSGNLFIENLICGKEVD